jgi:hypothetical protein
MKMKAHTLGSTILIIVIVSMLTAISSQGATTTTYTVEISETTSINDLVEEGDYDCNPHSYIWPSHYSMSEPGVYEIIIVDFGKTSRGKSLNKAKALEKLAELNLDPAPMALLLALGAQHPTCAYGKAGIVELDTSRKYNGFARNGILTHYSESSERIMYIDDISRPEGNCHADYCFAAVKKISQ